MGRSVARNSSTGRFVVAHKHVSTAQERISNDGGSTTPRQAKTVNRDDALAVAKRIAARNEELMRRLA